MLKRLIIAFAVAGSAAGQTPGVYPPGCNFAGTCTITAGGSYSRIVGHGTNSSPMINIATTAAVTLDHIAGDFGAGGGVVSSVSGTNVTLTNSTLVGYDPRSNGVQRGQAVQLTSPATVNIQNNAFYGASFGVHILNGTVSSLTVKFNQGFYFDDRYSNGSGGVIPGEPGSSLGHFVFIDGPTLPNGADVGWNVYAETVPFRSSINDVFNFYHATCASSAHCLVHDNYCEGTVVSPAKATSGDCFIADGTHTAGTSYMQMDNNYAVHYGNGGFGISSGNNNSGTGNTVVGCGQDAFGNWIVGSGANGVIVFDYYSQGTSVFVNNTFTNTSGGNVRALQGYTGFAFPPRQIANSYLASGLDPSNTIDATAFTNPCGTTNASGLAAEANARTAWAAKVSAAGVTIGPLP